MITDIRLQNFRSYTDASFEIGPGVNIIVGPNASGKTNLLESILVLCRGKSYRAKDAELINFKQTWARIDADFDNNKKRTLKITPGQLPAKALEYDGKTYQRLTPKQIIPTVLFEPNHLVLFSGGPERRRDYLDEILEQTTPGYTSLRLQYRRTLNQRNNLLKKAPPNLREQIFPWNVRLTQLGGQIAGHRNSLTENLNQNITETYQAISGGKTEIKLSYSHNWAINGYESQMLKKLETDLETDKLKGFTSHGPHREDLVLSFGGHPAAAAASRGELRTAVLALKIIELQVLAAVYDQTPILLLDDVFSELDGRRRHALTKALNDYQTFITTTDADLVIKNFTKNSNIIALS